MMRNKLGLIGLDDKDKSLILDLLTWMHKKKVDYTNTFCHLMDQGPKKEKVFENNDFLDWRIRWKKRLLKNNNSSDKYINLMKNNNPMVIPRNHKVEEALIAAEDGDFNPLIKILGILEKPYLKQKGINDYQQTSPLGEEYKTFCGT